MNHTKKPIIHLQSNSHKNNKSINKNFTRCNLFVDGRQPLPFKPKYKPAGLMPVFKQMWKNFKEPGAIFRFLCMIAMDDGKRI